MEKEEENEKERKEERPSRACWCVNLFAYREEHGWNTKLTPSSQFLEANVCIEGGGNR